MARPGVLTRADLAARRGCEVFVDGRAVGYPVRVDLERGLVECTLVNVITGRRITDPGTGEKFSRVLTGRVELRERGWHG